MEDRLLNVGKFTLDVKACAAMTQKEFLEIYSDKLADAKSVYKTLRSMAERQSAKTVTKQGIETK